MNTKNLPHVSPGGAENLPHRAMSRAPASHKMTMILLGCVAAATVLACLWGLYTLG